MTVFTTDSRHRTRATELRRAVCGANFPGGALITLHSLAQPGMLVEAQGITLVGEE